MSNPLTAYRGLPREVYILFMVQVVNRFGDFVVPFLTLFLTQKLGYSLEASAAIVTFVSLCSFPGAVLGGYLADKLGRKRTYLICQSCAAIALASCTIASPTVIVVLLTISTVFNSAVRPTLTAFVTDLLPPEKRKQGFSLLYLGINVGVAMGPLVAGFLFKNHLTVLFLGDALTSFVAIGLVWFNIKETMPTDEDVITHSEAEKVEKGSLLTALMKRPQILMFMMLCTLYSFIYSQHRFALPLVMDHFYGEDGARFFGYLMSTNAITVIVFTALVTNLIKNNKPSVNMSIAALCYFLGFGFIGLIDNILFFCLMTVVWTLGEVITVISTGEYIANNSPANYRARFNSISSLSWVVGNSVGIALMGPFIQKFSVFLVWPLVGGVALIASASMFGLSKYKFKKKTKEQVA